MIAKIVQQVAELPDRTSPDDWPEAMLVTSDELAAILRSALPASVEGSLREALARIVNASYTELRPVVEHYSHDPSAQPVIYPDAKVIRSHATPEEWALVQKVAGWFQAIAAKALSAAASADWAERLQEAGAAPASAFPLATLANIRALLKDVDRCQHYGNGPHCTCDETKIHDAVELMRKLVDSLAPLVSPQGEE